jgi:ABC-2 type transport system ATP-binding protein
MSQIVLQTQGLTKRFGSLVAVDDLNLEVCSGEIFGLLGPNGAGKTTSINMICGLLPPDSGGALIHGKPIQSRDTQVRARIGVCPQNTVVWEKLTCLEQLQFVGEMYGIQGQIARKRGEILLAKLDLVEKRSKLAGTLSGGMKRRLNLALALVHDPDLIILDEPEAGLDPQSRVLVREHIRSLAHHKTVILTTHNMDEAERLASRVAIIDHGKLLVVDTPEKLKHTVGEGDVLEVEVSGISLEQAKQAVLPIVVNVWVANRTLVIRAQGVVKKLPVVVEALQRLGAQVGEVRLRANTLEDVFIQLTGRRLRE